MAISDAVWNTLYLIDEGIIILEDFAMILHRNIAEDPTISGPFKQSKEPDIDLNIIYCARKFVCTVDKWNDGLWSYFSYQTLNIVYREYL